MLLTTGTSSALLPVGAASESQLRAWLEDGLHGSRRQPTTGNA